MAQPRRSMQRLRHPRCPVPREPRAPAPAPGSGARPGTRIRARAPAPAAVTTPMAHRGRPSDPDGTSGSSGQGRAAWPGAGRHGRGQGGMAGGRAAWPGAGRHGRGQGGMAGTWRAVSFRRRRQNCNVFYYGRGDGSGRRRGGGQRGGRDDGRAHRGAPRPERPGHREDGVLRRVDRPLGAGGSGPRATRSCAPPGSPTPRSRPAPTWRTWRATASRPSCGRRCSSMVRTC